MNNRVSKLVEQILNEFQINTNTDGLKETPKRVANMYTELLWGYTQDPKDIFTTFDIQSYEGLVTICDIQFYSLCEHHMIPFFGKVHIGYVPNNKILGLSKFARLVDIFSKRLQVQERLTQNITDAILKYLQPKGVIVYIEAEHMCMSMRGVKKPGSITKTLLTFGVCHKDQNLVNNFFSQIKKE